MPLGTDIYNAIEVCSPRSGSRRYPLFPTNLEWLQPQHLRGAEQGMGTITVRAATLSALIYDVAKSLIHHGFNRLVFVSTVTPRTSRSSIQ